VGKVNLFVVVWQGSADVQGSALSALASVTSVFTQLEPRSLACIGAGECAFVAMIQSPTDASGPRVYRHSWEGGVTFYSGLPVDSTGDIIAHNAEELHKKWASSSVHLEGQFCLIRLLRFPANLEIRTDPLGMEQVYYSQSGDTWIFSNNAAVVARIFGLSAFDPLGVSLALSMDWAGGDRTLIQGVRVLPGGQIWRFSGLEPPAVETYFSIRETAKCPNSLGSALSQELHEFGRMLSRLHKDFGELLCPLTGGRDSRVLAAILHHVRAPAHYFTSGPKASPDVAIAGQIADVLMLPHDVICISDEEIVSLWDVLARRLIEHTDGMVSLWQLADVYYHRPHTQHLRLSVTGVGGEIARGFYSDAQFNCSECSPKAVRDYLSRTILYQGALVCPEVIAMTKQYIAAFVAECNEAGIMGVNVPDVFYAEERVRRWGGSNARKNAVLGDRFSIFCTRPFVSLAFRLTPDLRLSETLHRTILAEFAPMLLEIPFDDGQIWGGGTGAPVTSTTSVVNHQALWFRALQDRLREMVLDIAAGSQIWDFISRSNVEQALSGTPESLDGHPSMAPLFAILTLAHFETLRRCSTGSQ